jgi:hypothetical protein
MKKLEVEFLTVAFQMQLKKSEWIVIYAKIENQYLRNIAFWNSENQALESHDGKPFEVKGEMIGWSKLPKYYE